MSDPRSHWDNVYATKDENEVSWYEASPGISLELIAQGTDRRSSIIDVGGGASHMPEALLEMGFADIACLDLSVEAQNVARARLGEAAAAIRWIVADIVQWSPDRFYDIWHDRAAFHFLTDPADQERYVSTLACALPPGGIAIIGTFAPDGPERCSGLPVARHDGKSLSALLGSGFVPLSERRHTHLTPGGASQKFRFNSFRRI